MRRILVTGGAGFIGANFVHYWLLRYPEDKLVVLDKLTYAGCASSLDSVTENERYAFQKGCIGDVRLLHLSHKFCLPKMSRNQTPSWPRSQNSEQPRIFRVTGGNQNSRKLLFIDLVNTNLDYSLGKGNKVMIL